MRARKSFRQVKEAIAASFQEVDANRDGVISPEELFFYGLERLLDRSRVNNSGRELVRRSLGTSCSRWDP